MHKLNKIPKFLVITCMFVLGLGSGVITSALFKKSPDQRLPASPNSRFQPFEYAKSMAPIRVEIAKGIAVPESSEDELLITGRIVTTRPLEGSLSYTWTVPHGVEVLEGEVHEELSGVKQGQLIELKLRVKGFSKEQQNSIALEASSALEGMRIGNADIILSREEDSLESLAPSLRREAQEQLAPQADRPARH